MTRLAVRGSCRAGVQRLGDRVERADVFCAPSILIAGQDLVDDEATRHGVVAKLRVEAHVAVTANDSKMGRCGIHRQISRCITAKLHSLLRRQGRIQALPQL